MAQIVMGKDAVSTVHGPDRQAAWSFLQKLTNDPTSPGLRIKTLKGAADKRVKTGRVNDDLRAVLIQLQGGDDPVYLVHGVWPHDEGNRIAATIRAETNPINGQFIIREVTQAAETSVSPSVPADANLDAIYAADANLGYSWLGSYQYSAASLYETFGLPQDVAKRAMTAQSGDDLLRYAEETSGWVQHVLLQLAVGDTKEEILEQLSLQASRKPASAPVAPADTQATDEELLAALKTDLGQSEYTFVEGEDELRAIIESGSFGQWRRFLHPEQRKYVTAKTNGAFRLSGAAGTGKTVVLLHRAARLAKQDPQAKIILTTYTRTLAEGLNQQLQFLDPEIDMAQMGEPGVSVAGVDALASRALRNAIERGNRARLDTAMKDVLGEVRPNALAVTHPKWAGAVAASGLDSAAPYLHPGFLQAEYDQVVLPGQIKDLRSYLRARRPGRGIALNRKRRTEVWKVVQAYRREAQVTGGLSHAEVAAVAAALMRRRIEQGDPYYADHLLVDEGQDLSAVQWQFLRGLVRQGPDDMFIAEDPEQRIYGRQLVLSHFGVNIRGRSRRLTLNYRTTAQNLARAVRALEGQTYLELEGEPVEPLKYRSARQGPEPVEVEVASPAEAVVAIVKHTKQWLESDAQAEGIGVLAPYRATVDRLAEALVAAGVPARVVARDAGGAADAPVQVMTMHRAKGLEFTRVALLVEPLKFDWDPQEREAKERSLVYVAMTRARDELVVVQRP